MMHVLIAHGRTQVFVWIQWDVLQKRVVSRWIWVLPRCPRITHTTDNKSGHALPYHHDCCQNNHHCRHHNHGLLHYHHHHSHCHHNHFYHTRTHSQALTL
jgi:hypothetical protein